MFGETTISYIKIWNHPIETTTYKWMFQVPGNYGQIHRKNNSNPTGKQTLSHLRDFFFRLYRFHFLLVFSSHPGKSARKAPIFSYVFSTSTWLSRKIWIHQTFQVTIMEVLNLIRLFWGWVFPYISRIHTAYIGEYLHFRYLKCLVINDEPACNGHLPIRQVVPSQ